MDTTNPTSSLENLVSTWPTEKLQSIWEAHFQASLSSARLSRQELISDVAWIESQRKSAA